MITVNRHNKPPKFAAVEDALNALAYGSPREVLVTLTPEAAVGWKRKTMRGFVVRMGRTEYFGIKRKPESEKHYLPSNDRIARIDYADGYSRQEYAPFYVKGDV